jgi:mRNA-degrading endonuclease RelE of RelBE toxin-antitoxin system
VSYNIQILGPAKPSLKNFEKFERNVARELIGPLKDDPRPPGCEPVVGYRDILRVKFRNIRVIYGVSEESRSVFILDVRRRNENTYKNIPVRTLLTAMSDVLDQLRDKPPDC